MRKAVVAPLVGAVIALIAWWPIEGAVTAVFWNKVSDGKGPEDYAIETLLAGQDKAFYYLIRHGPDIGKNLDDGNCSWHFDVASDRIRDLRSGPVQLNGAIHHERNNMNAQVVYAIAGETLRSLPNVTIGALRGCVEGSLFVGVCRHYVAQRLVSAMTAHKREIESKADTYDDDAIKMACAALIGTRWPPSPRTM